MPPLHATKPRRQPGPATLRALAHAVGLDPSTVSRALAGKPGVSTETRALVESAALKMDYKPNALAQALRSRKSGLVGLVVPDIRNEWYTTLAAVMETRLSQAGFVMQLSVSHDDRTRERQAVRMLADHQAAGVILAPRGPRLPAVPGLDGRLPLIEVSRYTVAATDKIYADDEIGALEAVTYLLSLGHRRIGLVTNALGLTTTSSRVRGYTRALHTAGLTIEMPLMLAHQNSVEFGAAAATRFLRLREPPTAVVAGGHLIALGILQALANRRLRVPDDMSLLTFDDTSWIAAWPGGITALRAPWLDMAGTAVDLLLERMEIAAGRAPLRSPIVRVFPYEMMIRGSTVSLGEGGSKEAPGPIG